MEASIEVNSTELQKAVEASLDALYAEPSVGFMAAYGTNRTYSTAKNEITVLADR